MNDPLTSDTVDRLQGGLDRLNASAERFGQSLVSAFGRGVVAGKSFDDILRSIGQRFIDLALNAALQPLQSLAGSLLSQVGQSVGRALPFADGGVVASPTYFSAGGTLGLMGEAGAEAIMPLARGPDGKLGVRGGGSGVTVNVSITARDIESFRGSEAQISAALARAVARGRRGT